MTVRRTKLSVERYNLGSLRLYREDLHAIALAAAEAGDLAITCDGFEATSPDDFSDALPEKLKAVSITAKRTGSSSFLEIQLSTREASVQLAEPDTLLAGIISRIRLICEPQRRPLRTLLVRKSRSAGSSGDAWNVAWIGASALVATAVLISTLPLIASSTATPSAHHASDWSVSDTATTVVCGILLLVASSYALMASRPWVTIINAPRADRPTYWQRTHDMWLVGVITALLGAVAGYLLGRFS